MTALAWVVFGGIAALHLAITAYACWRFLLYRRLPSLVFAALPLGWILACARKLRLFGRSDWTTSVLLAVAGLAGGVSVLIILHHESQQKHPFR